MRPRPVIRWKSFWFGILVLGFLGWAWRDSRHHQATYTIHHIWDGSVVIPQGLWHGDSVLGIRIVRHLGPVKANLTGKGTFDFQYVPVTKRLNPDLPPLRWETFPPYTTPRGAIVAEMLIEFPHWSLILFFLIPWASFLAWRWRRQRILTKAHDAAPAL